MDNNAKIINQNSAQVAQTDQAQPQPQTQAQPVGSLNKETFVSESVSEYIKPADAELQISKELRETGVEEKSDKPNLTPEHKDLVDHAGPHVPVPSSSSGKIAMPMSEEEITDKLKAGQDDDSGKWLAGLLTKIIKVIGL